MQAVFRVRVAMAAFAVLALGACGDGVSQPGATGALPGNVTSTSVALPTPAVATSRVRATGRVVSVPGRAVRFCAPVAVATVGYEPGKEPAPEYCDFGVDVVGVDMGALSMPRTKNGATEGQAALEGGYLDGLLTVDKQRAPTREDQRQPGLPTTVPCPAPPNGWPNSRPEDIFEPNGAENMEQAAAEAYRREHPGVIADVAMLRPSETQVLMLVTVNGDVAADVAAVEAALRPAYGARLCVIHAAYSDAQITKARTDVQARQPAEGARLGIFSSGTSMNAAAQTVVSVDVVLGTEELKAMAADYPTGMIELRPWLQPAVG